MTADFTDEKQMMVEAIAQKALQMLEGGTPVSGLSVPARRVIVETEIVDRMSAELRRALG